MFLQRYGGGQAKEAKSTLLRLRRNISARLAQEPTEFQRARLTAVLADVEQLSRDAFGEVARNTVRSSIDLAKDEAAFATQSFNKVTSDNAIFKLPSDQSLLQAIDSSRMTLGELTGVTINDALRDFSDKKTKEITNTIADSLVLGDTTPQISVKVATLIGVRQVRQVEALVRTIVNNTSSIARNETMLANSDIVDEYQWISTLDGRTTLICASRDLKKWLVGQGPLPPAHYGCRSTTIPVVKDEFNLGAKVKGQRASKGAEGGAAISANKSYGGWLRDQPKEFIDEALGIERSKLFRSGKLTIDKFVDPTGRVYTLQQLRNMNPLVFQEF